MHLNFVQHGLYHLAGAFDQIDDGKQDLSVALAELLDDGGRLAGSASHNMVRFLHGGWLLFRVLFGNRILSKPAPPPPTNLQLRPGHNPVRGRYGELEQWDGFSILFVILLEQDPQTATPSEREWLQALKNGHDSLPVPV